ncbi:hypothetical protein T492DRAFT_875924 [Pavlovales sp. CCMP2436]|nr:hypothetical protein T492DRAFT_875924 [Pavlovales sp. CCMP2436]
MNVLGTLAMKAIPLKGKFGMLKTSAAAAATGGPGPDISNQSAVPRQPLSPPLQRAWPAYDAEFA